MSDISTITIDSSSLFNSSYYTNTTSFNSSDLIFTTSQSDLEVNGSLIINGRNLEERLKTIETLLGIPERNLELEHKHPKLKQLYEEYMKELAKYKMWEQLNK